MKIAERTSNVKSNGVIDSVSFGIKKEGLAHIFSILRSSLYSDKLGSILREICSNSKDSHMEAGKADVPITVVLPSRFMPTLSISDEGTGLSDEEIKRLEAEKVIY